MAKIRSASLLRILLVVLRHGYCLRMNLLAGLQPAAIAHHDLLSFVQSGNNFGIARRSAIQVAPAFAPTPHPDSPQTPLFCRPRDSTPGPARSGTSCFSVKLKLCVGIQARQQNSLRICNIHFGVHGAVSSLHIHRKARNLAGKSAVKRRNMNIHMDRQYGCIERRIPELE